MLSAAKHPGIYKITLVWACSALLLVPTRDGAVRGSVEGPGGTLIAAAVVTLRSERGGKAISTSTDSLGRYHFSAVNSGVYQAVVAGHAYETLIRSGLRVSDGSSLVLNFVLKPLPASPPSASSMSSLSTIHFYDQPSLKAGQLTNPAAGGGYSDSASARGRKMVTEYLSPAGMRSRAPGHNPESDAGHLVRLQQAVEEKPSQANFQRWGSALLARQKLSLAEAVFRQGAMRYENSAPLWTGLGISLYSEGRYAEAVQALTRAVELRPASAQAYDFLADACQLGSCSDDVTVLFKRFAVMQPRNPRAHYDYALSLWRSPGAAQDAAALNNVESEMKAAIALNPRFSEAYFQLGTLYDQENLTVRAIPQYQHAIQLSPELAAAHYRLGQDYLRAGKSSEARTEFKTYEKLTQGSR